MSNAAIHIKTFLPFRVRAVWQAWTDDLWGDSAHDYKAGWKRTFEKLERAWPDDRLLFVYSGPLLATRHRRFVQGKGK